MSVLNDQVDAFTRYVGGRLAERDLSLEESLAAFRVYEAERSRFKQQIAPAIKELDAGRATPLDIDAVIARGREVLAAERNVC